VYVVLETERLVLRRFTVADVDLLVELDSDPEVMRFLTGGKPTPREVVERSTLPAILREYAAGTGHGHWAAVTRATGEFLGWFALARPADGSRDEADLGYRLRRPAWGRGYASEGSRALVRRAFTELGLERVFAQTMAVNTASRRVMEKAGLRLVRTFHPWFPDPVDGTEHGEVEYALTRAEWERREAGGDVPSPGGRPGGTFGP
jgi:RimJ/RimL family protein N-acetyltransferase